MSNPHNNSLLKAYSLACKLTFLLVLLSGVFIIEAAGGESSCPVPVLPPYRDPSPHSYGGACPSVGRRARGDGGGCDSHIEGENKNLLSVHTVYLTDPYRSTQTCSSHSQMLCLETLGLMLELSLYCLLCESFQENLFSGILIKWD